jgi:hypothetical protein
VIPKVQLCLYTEEFLPRCKEVSSPRTSEHAMTDQQVFATVEKRAKWKGGAATGSDTLKNLASVSSLLGGRQLSTLATEYESSSRLLLQHYRNPLALMYRIKAVRCALQSGLPKVPKAEAHWESVLVATEEKVKTLREAIHEVLASALEPGSDGPCERTSNQYVKSLAHAMAKLNVRDVKEMIDNPENVEKLKANCGSVNTFKDHVKVILIYFKALPSLKESHHESYRAWVDAMAIETKRVVKESRSNAPANSRQSANWVTMDEWREALGKLRKEKDPHATLKSSMTLVWVN